MAEMLRGVPFDYEPIRVNRFVAEFPSELGIAVWAIQEFGAPSLKINPVKINYMNTVRYVAGIGEWSPIEITFLDLIGPSTSQQVMEWVRLHHESLTGRQGYAAGYQKDIILKALDPTGVEVQKWTLRQCTITDVSFDGFKKYSINLIALII